MKRALSLIIAALIVIAVCTACGTDTAVRGELGITVYTTVFPLYDFARNIGGGLVEVIEFIPSGDDPHTWEPSAADIEKLEEADVFIYSGLGMEHWVEAVLEVVTNKNLLLVNASEGIVPLDEEGYANEDFHHGDHAGHGHEHDPHVWLSVKNARIQVKNITNAFIETDPDNLFEYKANYDAYAGELADLDEKFEDMIADSMTKDIVVTHKAFGYLCHEYGLNQVAAGGFSFDEEPSPADVAAAINFIRKNNIKAVFYEASEDSKVAQVISSETGAQAISLSAMERAAEEDSYIELMAKNLNELRFVLR